MGGKAPIIYKQIKFKIKNMAGISKIKFNRLSGGTGSIVVDNTRVSGMLIVSGTAGLAGTSGDIEMKVFTIEAVKDLGLSEAVKYQIKNYLDISESYLYLKIITETSDYSEVETLALYANGECGQIGVYDLDTEFVITDLSALHNIAIGLTNDKIPTQILLCKSIGSTLIEDLVDLSESEYFKTSLHIGEDLTKRDELGLDFLGSVGVDLGLVARTPLGESLAWVKKNNIQDGKLFAEVGFIDGSTFSSKTKTVLDLLSDRQLSFYRKFPNDIGVYPAFDSTAVSNSSDFNTIANNLVYDWSLRRLNATLIPELNSKLGVQSGGVISEPSAVYYEELCNRVLNSMKINGELSDFEVAIDRAQNVVANDTLEITVLLLGNGVARYIELDLGYTI